MYSSLTVLLKREVIESIDKMMQILTSYYCTKQPSFEPRNAFWRHPDLSGNALDPKEEQKGAELTS